MLTIKRIAEWLKYPDRNILRGISTGAKWSALTRIGNSYAVRLTIAAPFIGAFLLFNHTILEYLDFSDRFLRDIDKYSSNDHISDFAFKNIYFMYFGLFFIGIGSIIYSVFCPDNISKFPFSDEYNRSRVGLNSPTLCVSSFESVAEAYARDSNNLPWREKTRKDSLAYSDELGRLSYSLLLRLHSAWDWGPYRESEPPQQTQETELISDQERERDFRIYDEGNVQDAYYTANGYVDIGSMARDLITGPRVMWATIIPLKDSSFNFQSDVYHLHYMIDDLSMPYQRLSCTAAYAIGFFILFIPSVETFARVLGHVLSL